MRTRPLFAVVALILCVTACKHKEPLPSPPQEDIPREIAVNNLKTLLPSSLEVFCTLPKDSLKPSEIKEWVVGNDGFEIRPTKGKIIAINYSDILQTRLEKSGSKFYVKVFTTVQRETNREHVTFVWSTEDSAKTADQLFNSLKKK